VEHAHDLDTGDLEAADPDPADLGREPSLLPTMADLDRLAADLDRVDATLAALDRGGDGAEVPGVVEVPRSDSPI
jgi:hypothetical protein